MNPKLDALVTAATDALQAPVKPKSRVWAFLNSSFFLTFLGGAIISVAGAVIQHRYTDAAAKEQRQLVEAAAKREAVKEFTESMVYGVEYLDSMLPRELWLKEHQEDKDRNNLKYPDNRSYAETRSYWESLRTKLFEKKHPLVACHACLVTFQSPETITALRELVVRYQEFTASADAKAEDDAYQKINAQVDRVLTAMRRELHTLPDENKKS